MVASILIINVSGKMMMVMNTETTSQAEFNKKLSNTEAELRKKAVLTKKFI